MKHVLDLRRDRRWAGWGLGLALALALAPGAALADEPKKPDKATIKAADAAFDKGKELLQKKKYADACAAFEESVRLVPAIGAQLNVANCYEQWGKVGTAYRQYDTALQMASAAKDDRVGQITDHMKDLDRAVPKLTVALPPGLEPPAGMAVLLDGADLARAELGKPQRVDPGAHVVVVRVPDKEDQSLEVTIDARKSTEVVLPLTAEAPAATPSPPPPPATDRGRTQRIAGLVAGGVGVVGLGVATFLALDASGDYDDAFAAHCSAATNECTTVGQAAIDDARSRGTAGTVVGSIALAAIATGAVLYFTAPKATAEATPRTAIRPLLWQGGAGLVVSGSL